jgi:hypothetical protein
MTLLMQLTAWLDAIADKLANAARSPRPAADAWDTLAWTTMCFGQASTAEA